MRSVATVVAAAVALSVVGGAQGVNIYSETGGTSGFGSASPPPAGTQEFAFDSFGAGSYYWDNSAYGRTIATADPGPSLTFTTDDANQIRPILRSTTGNPLAGDVDLFKVTVPDPNTFRAWTGRTTTTANSFVLTLFKTDGTAVAASLGAVQVGAVGTVAYTAPLSAAPVNPADPGIINGASLGLTAGDYILAISNYSSATGKGQPKNNAGQDLFTLVAGSVVTPNALSDIKLSTDPLVGWNLYSVDGGTPGVFDLGVDQLLARTGNTAGTQGYINVVVPEPASLGSLGLLALGLLRRRASN